MDIKPNAIEQDHGTIEGTSVFIGGETNGHKETIEPTDPGPWIEGHTP